MSDLRDFVTELGFSDARTLLQSGNLVFRGDGRKSAALEQLLETEAAKRLGLQADFLVRSADEWKDVVARNPFPKEAERDPSHLVVMFLKSAVDPKNVNAAQAAIAGRESIRADGRQVYIVYPDGIGRSRVSNVFLEGKLGIRGTARNWNTVLKLPALADECGKRGKQS
jgi:uncharacterized protein (DUF1697 family)